jgi:hypothetical protein
MYLKDTVLSVGHKIKTRRPGGFILLIAFLLSHLLMQLLQMDLNHL